MELQKFYRFVNMSVEDALKTFDKGLYSAGFFNFGNDLHKILREKIGLDLKKDSKERLLRYHWNNLISFNGKLATYFISLTSNPDPFQPLDFDSLIRFEVQFPSNRIAERINEINERSLVVKASKENGAKYNENEYTFLDYILPSRFIKGFDLLERIYSRYPELHTSWKEKFDSIKRVSFPYQYKKLLTQENENFNPFV